MTETDKICEICYNKVKMKCYSCTTCKQIICDECFSKILLKKLKSKPWKRFLSR